LDVGGSFDGAFDVAAVKDVEVVAAGAADIADAVWDEATSGHVGAGSFGKLVQDIPTDVDTALTSSHGSGSWATGATFTDRLNEIFSDTNYPVDADTSEADIQVLNNVTDGYTAPTLTEFTVNVDWNSDWDSLTNTSDLFNGTVLLIKTTDGDMDGHLAIIDSIAEDASNAPAKLRITVSAD